MKKLRFLIAIVLIFSLLPVFCVSASEQTDSVKATETYEFKKLEAFGLISESDPIFYYENVSRGFFISYMMKCYPSYSNSLIDFAPDNYFADVNEKTEGVNEILTAAEIGLINKGKGSNFRPNEFITKSEAAKIFANILGYSEYAERIGGYPSGYLAVAQKLELFSGCEFTPEGYFTIKDFLKAYGNLLDTEVLEVRSVSVEASGNVIGQEYKNVEERTLLYNAFGIFKAEGIVESNEYTSLYLTSELNPGEVEINNYVYKSNDTGASSLLGYNTTYYYKKAKDAVMGELVFIEPDGNNIVNTSTSFIVKDSVTNTNFRYYKDETAKKYYDLTITQSATLIHNGEIKSVTKDNLYPINGTVTLIDNNDDKAYDVIYVMDYRTIIVSDVSYSEYTVMDALGGPTITLDPEDEEYDVMLEVKQPVSKSKEYNISYDLYGEYLPPVKNEFSELKKGDIILYAESLNNNFNIKYVKVSRDVVKGVVSSIRNDRVVIDNHEYEVGPVRVGKVVKDEENNDITVLETKNFTVSLGENGQFYLDVFGRIVNKTLEQKAVYGYLNDIEKSVSLLTTVVHANLFSENGRWLDLELAKKVKTNMTDTIGNFRSFAYLTPTEVYNALKARGDFRQLITYSVNTEGKINNITVAQSVAAYSDDEQTAIDQDIFRSVYSEEWGNTASDCKITASTNFKYEVGKAIGYLDIQVDNSTRVFTICKENPELTRIEPNQNLIYGGPFIPYDLNERRVAGTVVIFKEPKHFKVGTTGDLMFVKEVIKTFNSSGDLVSGVTGICGDEVITVLAAGTKVSEAIDLLQKGDVIQFVTDAKGEIYDNPPTSLPDGLDTDTAASSIKRRFNVENQTAKLLDTASGDSLYGATATIYFTDAKANRIMLIGQDDKKRFSKVTSSTKYYFYDTENVELTPATLADLSKGTFCFMKCSEYSISQVYIIK